MTPQRRKGFTLLELVVVIAILFTVAGIVFAATGPSREKARQSYCINNLRQIGSALALYRMDYDGADLASSYSGYGIPPSIFNLTSYLKGGAKVLQCPDVPSDKVAWLSNNGTAAFWSDYCWGVWEPGDPQDTVDGPWPVLAAERGSMFPIVVCIDHDFHAPDRPSPQSYDILLRLDGSVSAGYHARYGPDPWAW